MAKRVVVKRSRRSWSRAKAARPKMTIPLAVVAGFAPVATSTYTHGRQYGITGPEGAVSEFSRTMIGIDPNNMNAGFQAWRMKWGLLPVVIGLVVHKAAGYFGINRMIAKAGVPLIRI